jgi:hypothetical protein
VAVSSAAFPFTETGSVGSTTDYRAMLNFSVPIGMTR